MEVLCRRIAEREDALGTSEAELAARHARLAQAAGSARRELLALRADRAKASGNGLTTSRVLALQRRYRRTMRVVQSEPQEHSFVEGADLGSCSHSRTLRRENRRVHHQRQSGRLRCMSALSVGCDKARASTANACMCTAVQYWKFSCKIRIRAIAKRHIVLRVWSKQIACQVQGCFGLT